MEPAYEFYGKLAKMINAGQSNSILLSGNVHDSFWNGTEYVPLVQFLVDRFKKNPDRMVIVYELNGPIRIAPENLERLREAWIKLQMGTNDPNAEILKNLRAELTKGGASAVKSEYERQKQRFDQAIMDAIGDSTNALEFMRQLCIASRKCLKENLIVVIESADIIIPCGHGDIASLNDNQLKRVCIVQDWFCEPAFANGKDIVVMVAESQSMLHPRIAKLPQVLSVEVPSPNTNDRQFYIDSFVADIKNRFGECPSLWDGNLAQQTAGLTILALRQLLKGAYYARVPLSASAVVDKVEEFIQSQVGEDVVEFSRPNHKLADIVGARKLKQFILNELLPRFRAMDKTALSGCAVAGSIGSGKTYIFEAVAAELGVPVIVLKNIRSQWYGQTDVIFERLRRTLEALDQVLIFLDEADTQFGGVDANAHETERRLTGKIQAMMSDSKLKGRVKWLLMTARIHLLSPDIRRPGRAGDLIIPVLDPVGDDRKEFIDWALKDLGLSDKDREVTYSANYIPSPFSAADFASLKAHIAAHREKCSTLAGLSEVISDIIPPAIGPTREYQNLQALLNCTRRSLLPDIVNPLDQQRLAWAKRIAELEAEGIK